MSESIHACLPSTYHWLASSSRSTTWPSTDPTSPRIWWRSSGGKIYLRFPCRRVEGSLTWSLHQLMAFPSYMAHLATLIACETPWSACPHMNLPTHGALGPTMLDLRRTILNRTMLLIYATGHSLKIVSILKVPQMTNDSIQEVWILPLAYSDWMISHYDHASSSSLGCTPHFLHIPQSRWYPLP